MKRIKDYLKGLRDEIKNEDTLGVLVTIIVVALMFTLAEGLAAVILALSGLSMFWEALFITFTLITIALILMINC